jgi:retron-type reverse transcriptase
MKRYGNLYSKIIEIENLILADKKARKGKQKSIGVKIFDKRKESNLIELNQLLFEKRFKTSEYKIFKIYEPKERDIFRLPYYPDRIVHHAIMNVLEPIWCSVFTSDTFSCIKQRGIKGAMIKVKRALNDYSNTKYCLKLDIRKYYPSIDHDILKSIIRKKIKCNDTLTLIDQIIDSASGVPIGNYLSQYFANLYLAYFDHYIKEELAVKYYFRYADDIVILHGDKAFLHQLFLVIKAYLSDNLKLDIKSNYQIFPIAKNNGRGLDFVGYVFYHDHVKLRKGIKKSFLKKAQKVRKLNSKNKRIQLASYMGWLKHCNSKHFIKKQIYEGNL